jgi:hypothetical protein
MSGDRLEGAMVKVGRVVPMMLLILESGSWDVSSMPLGLFLIDKDCRTNYDIAIVEFCDITSWTDWRRHDCRRRQPPVEHNLVIAQS